MTTVLLTGASGFIASRVSTVIPNDFYLRQVYRKEPEVKPSSDYVLCDFDNAADLSSILKVLMLSYTVPALPMYSMITAIMQLMSFAK